MARTPTELRRLLDASSDVERQRAWARFLERHSKLILKVAHESAQGYDGAMDRYTFVLERLRHDDFHRLRQYTANGRAKFTTWLVVVVRRLCLDHVRHVYGRPRSAAASEEQDARKKLVDFVMEEIDPERTVNHRENGKTDGAVRRTELFGRLREALAVLPPDQRLALKLRFEDETPVSDIAKVLDVPTVFHVYRRVNKTLARLRRDLEQRGVDSAVP